LAVVRRCSGLPRDASRRIVALADGLMLHRALDPTDFRWPNIRGAVDVIFTSLRAREPG
jgi:hypothetical protein